MLSYSLQKSIVWLKVSATIQTILGIVLLFSSAVASATAFA